MVQAAPEKRENILNRSIFQTWSYSAFADADPDRKSKKNYLVPNRIKHLYDKKYDKEKNLYICCIYSTNNWAFWKTLIYAKNIKYSHRFLFFFELEKFFRKGTFRSLMLMRTVLLCAVDFIINFNSACKNSYYSRAKYNRFSMTE